MRKITTCVSVCCLACLAAIMLVLVASHLLTPVRRAIPPAAPSMVRVSQSDVRSLSVFEAIAGDSYEIFIADDRSGQTRQLTTHFASDRFPALSPDGNQVAFVSWRDGDSEIYVIDLATGALRNVSNHAGRDGLPVWSPDGTMLAYVSDRKGKNDIFVADVGRALTKNVTRSPYHDSGPVWSSDGQRLVFTSDRDGSSRPYALDFGEHTLTVDADEKQWQTAQNAGKLDVTQGAMPG